jgi:hypothetical protein
MCRPRDTLYPQKLAVASPTTGGYSVGIVRSPTKTTEFSFHNSYILGEGAELDSSGPG